VAVHHPGFRERLPHLVFDHVGAGNSDLAAYSRNKYATLAGYAADLLEICRTEHFEQVIFVGHSVSSMIGVLAAAQDPMRFAHLILIGPSPHYIDDGEYVGGFSRDEIHGLLDFLDSNYLGWSATMAPVIMGNSERPELATELTSSFCRTDPQIAREFARVTFLSDNRMDLEKLRIPSLILQCSDDAIAPTLVGDYVHQHLPGSTLVQLAATGHCPNLSAPEETIAAIKTYLGRAANS